MDHSLNSLNNFDFLARSFARMHAEGRPVDILAVTGNMDEEHRTWFCARYAWYCQQMMQACCNRMPIRPKKPASKQRTTRAGNLPILR